MNESCSYLEGTHVTVGVTTKVQGGHLQGSFRLKYMGYHTGLLAHDILPDDLDTHIYRAVVYLSKVAFFRIQIYGVANI